MGRETDADLANVPVLIVEDEEASARLIASALKTHGYETRIAACAEEAIAAMAPLPPRAIVLDLVLPRLSGLVLAEKLKRDPVTRDIPIIATSPFSPKDAAHIAREAGCADYIRKPIDPKTFARLLRALLARKK
jgi:CheY-like chemotaxis protein